MLIMSKIIYRGRYLHKTLKIINYVVDGSCKDFFCYSLQILSHLAVQISLSRCLLLVLHSLFQNPVSLSSCVVQFQHPSYQIHQLLPVLFNFPTKTNHFNYPKTFLPSGIQFSSLVRAIYRCRVGQQKNSVLFSCLIIEYKDTHNRNQKSRNHEFRLKLLLDGMISNKQGQVATCPYHLTPVPSSAAA